MDFLVFVMENGKILHYGTIPNVKNIHDARHKLKAQPYHLGKTFYLIKSEELHKVVL